MSNDIRSIVERLAILEGRITPTTVKQGLNPQQKEVPQLPALFKPKHISVLKSKTDPEHPMHGYMVGDSVERDEEPLEEEVLEEAKVDEEKLLDKVKKSLTDYLSSIEDKYKDDNIRKKAADKDIGKKDKVDHDLLARQQETESIAVPECTTSIKSIAFEDGRICEIHGDEVSGFAIKHGNNTLPSRFRTLDEAEMAVEMYKARCRKNDESSDYIEER